MTHHAIAMVIGKAYRRLAELEHISEGWPVLQFASNHTDAVLAGTEARAGLEPYLLCRSDGTRWNSEAASLLG